MARMSIANMNNAIEAVIVPSTTYYMALFVTDPGVTGTTGEVTGGSYGRQPVAFSGASAGVETNVATVSFTGMPAEPSGVPFVGIFTAVTGGTYECGGLSGLPAVINAGATLTFPIGSIAAQIQ